MDEEEKTQPRARPVNPACSTENCHHPSTFHSKADPRECKAYACQCKGFTQ